MANDIETILRNRLVKAVSTLPRVLANVAVNYSSDAFKNQAWDGQQWRRRVYRKGEGPSILIKTGNLRRGTRAENISAKGFIWVNDIPYARAHNEGFKGSVKVKKFSRQIFGTTKVGTGLYSVKSKKERTKKASFLSGHTKVKAHTRKMNLPRRQFMGKSAAFIQHLITAGKAHLFRSFKS